MKSIRHEEVSRDSLFTELEQNLNTIYGLWSNGDVTLMFTVAILCAVKLEAFINVAGNLKLDHWDILERKLSFKEKCTMVCSSLDLTFDSTVEPNKTAVEMFEIRNSIVHPKMKLKRTDEYITMEEYEHRRNNFFEWSHPLRKRLTRGKIKAIKDTSDEFVIHWGPKLLDGFPEYWLSSGSTGGFTHDPSRQG